MKTKTKNPDLEILKKKIDAEDDIGEISGFIRDIANVSVNDAKDLIKSLDARKLKTKIDAEKSLGKIGLCVEMIGIDEESAKDIIKNLDLEKLKDKIDADEDIEMIGWCVGRISITSGEVAKDLIRSMDLEKLKDKIDAERSTEEICWCFANISVGDANAAERLVPVVKKKIEAEGDNILLWNSTRYLNQGDKKVVSKLVSQLNPENAKTPEVKNEIIELKKSIPE